VKKTRDAALLAVAVLGAGVASAQPKDFKPPTKQLPPALDRIEMTEFLCDPATIPPNATQVTLKVTVKNLTSGPQAETLNGLKLRILRTTPQPDVVELETNVVNLAAGATQSVSQKVNVAPGTRAYFARVDVDDVLHEPFVQRANNEKRLTITIASASRDQAAAPGSSPQLVTQVLDYEKAHQAGAVFTDGVEGQKGGCGFSGQFANTGPDYSVLFWARCLFSLNGVRLTPEAFTGWHLKNGWKVKRFDFGKIEKSAGDWQWRQTPAIGTDDPSAKLHIWVDAGGEVSLPLVITIEGPAGTNPYQ